MDEASPTATERAERRQVKRFLFYVVGSFVVGLFLVSPRTPSLLAVPFLLGWYACYRWLQEPLPDEVDGGAGSDVDGFADGDGSRDGGDSSDVAGCFRK